MKHIFLFFLFATGMVNIIKANTIKVESQPALWSAFLIKYELSQRIYFHNELRYRLIEKLNNPQQFILRPSIHYQPTKWLTAGLGYSYILDFPYGPLVAKIQLPQHHIFQEIKTKHEKQGLNFSFHTRLRYEERFMARASIYRPQVIENYHFASRIRAMAQVSYKLKAWTFSVYDELFTQGKIRELNTNQNWFGFNISRKFSNSISAYVGYMNMFLDRGIPLTYESHQVIRMGVKYSTKLHTIPPNPDF